MIEIKSLSKSYLTEDTNFMALSEVNLKIEGGEFVVILGQSGCGKSTLLNILGGMDKPSDGQVLIDGHDLAKKRNDQLAKYRREEVGMIFQKFNLINDASVLENVKMPLKFSGKSDKEQTEIAKKVLASVGLSEKIKSLPKKLSGGQQQRVAIARALVNSPKILLCDEPTGNLDSKTGEEIINLLVDLNRQGYTIVMVTHNEAYAKNAHRVVKMLDGEIISDELNSKLTLPEEASSRKTSKNISYKTTFGLATKNLKRRKLRFFLTSFGIAIGAMAIVILVSFGAGLQKEVMSQLESVSQVEEISVTGEKIDSINFSVGTDFAKKQKKNLNDATVAELEKISNVEAVYPETSIYGEMINGDKLSVAYGTGLTPIKYVKQEMKDKVKFGRFTENDDENGVVIPYGQAVALGFDNPADSIGKEVKIKANGGDKEFTTKIIGVFGQDEKFVYNTLIPQKTALNWYKEIKADELKKSDPSLYNSITVRANDTSKVSEIKKAVDDKGYGATSYEDIAKQMTRVFTIMQIVMGVVGGIALLVASLGIVNTMIMSVLERTKEIGIMKAVGARNRDIRSIFLSEASLIGLFGGLVGLLLGFLGSRLIQTIVNSYMMNKNATGSGDELSFYIPSYLSVGVVIFSILVAALAGYFPAKRAAKLDPAEALREE